LARKAKPSDPIAERFAATLTIAAGPSGTEDAAD